MANSRLSMKDVAIAVGIAAPAIFFIIIHQAGWGRVYENFFVSLFLVYACWQAARFIYLARRQHHRQTNNLCVQCGYDLRASKTQCPECGKEL
jgi:uncharacterized paraquat-inducible protein A